MQAAAAASGGDACLKGVGIEQRGGSSCSSCIAAMQLLLFWMEGGGGQGDSSIRGVWLLPS